MAYTLMDYQILALLGLAFIAGCAVTTLFIAYEKHVSQHHMRKQEFWKRIWRELQGRGFENRTVHSNIHGN